MAGVKTKQHNGDVIHFIDAFADTEQKKQDSYDLIQLMQDFTGHEPKMWGPSIIGFGVYHIPGPGGKKGADWPMLGFSPRKTAISLYVYTGLKEHGHLLEGLGKFTMGKACIYVKKLSDIDQEQLKKIMGASMVWVKEKYGD